MAFIDFDICYADQCPTTLSADQIQSGTDTCLTAYYQTSPYTNTWVGTFSDNASLEAALAPITSYKCSNQEIIVNGETLRIIWVYSGNGITLKGGGYWINNPTYCPPPPDIDNDGIPDEFDLYPADSTIYTAGISDILYNTSTGELVAGVITTNTGDKFSFGTVPSDLTGYSSESIDGDITLGSASDLQSNLENITGNLNLTKISGNSLDVASDGTFNFTDFVTSTNNLPSLIIGNSQTKAPTSGVATGMDSGTSSSGSETDNEALKGILTNTKKTGDNVARTGDYLKITNDLLGQISIKIGKSASTEVAPGDSGPTALEIGQAVNDKLIASTQHHDPSQTTGIPDKTFNDLSTSEGTKYSNRLSSFKTNLEGSDLFSLTTSLIGDIPVGGSSSINVNVGKWGNLTDNQISFDFLDYSSALDILKYLLPILTGFAVLRILILKQG